MVRNPILIIFILFWQPFCFGQNPKAIEADLYSKFAKIAYWHKKIELWGNEVEYNPVDSLIKTDSIFLYKLLYCTNKYPFTLAYGYESFKVDTINFTVLLSDDKLFRIYNWDNEMGGTCYYFNTIFQYKSKTGVRAFLAPYENDPIGGNTYYYDSIYTFKTNNRTYYLVTYSGHFSNKDMYEGIKIFFLENGQLNDTLHLVKTKTGIRNELGYHYDFFASKLDYSKHSIYFDKVDSSIYIPIIFEDGKVTSKFIRYKFNNQYFEKVEN